MGSGHHSLGPSSCPYSRSAWKCNSRKFLRVNARGFHHPRTGYKLCGRSIPHHPNCRIGMSNLLATAVYIVDLVSHVVVPAFTAIELVLLPVKAPDEKIVAI